MTKEEFEWTNFKDDTLLVIAQVNTIGEEYHDQGLTLTLRQLHYQFVSRDLYENTQRNYKRLGDIVNKGRLAGLIDWDYIEDRTRNLESLSHWDSPAEIVQVASRTFRIDKWELQPERVEVWIEKEALAGVIEGVCEKWDVPFIACRGYMSQSEMYAAAQRMKEYRDRDGNEQTTTVLHLGDHDPSGINMTDDIERRLELFEADVVVDRIGLNMDQIRKFNPPPNFAKQTDSRFRDYELQFGSDSWELDALDPTVLQDLIDLSVTNILDVRLWKEAEKEQEEGRRRLREIVKNLKG